ncbi:MAG: DUF1080 domain-containing protein, partial [Acidobacteria bacterium]|nr:DUF1080 domain-containing protein [Acidobacteriota bacterium]
KTFNNFTMTGNANWKITDGVAEADVPRGYLVSKASYTDFDLHVEVWVLPASNAGVMLRITDVRDPGIQNAYEVNVNDTRKDQDGRTGSIVNVAKPLVKFDSGNKWTAIDITVRGPKMTVRMDGTLVAEGTDAKYKTGQIALQAAGDVVKYRNVQIRVVK